VAVAVFLILTIETLVHTAAGTPASRKAAATTVLTPAQKGQITKAANKAKAATAAQATNVTPIRKTK
jgi:hypothetical protein